MGKLTSRFGRPRYGRLILVCGLMVTLGCGEGGGAPGPGASTPSPTPTGATADATTKSGIPKVTKPRIKAAPQPTGPE